MTIKVRNAMKNVSIFSMLLLFFISCSDDELNSVDAGFINNLNFVTDTIYSEITFSSEDVLSVQSTTAGQYLLGVYNEPSLGTLSSSFVSQLALPADIYSYSEDLETGYSVESSLDDVVLYIPYQATVTDVNENGLYLYELDSIYGIKIDDLTYESFDLEVHELETFLNPLDPSDPSKPSVYYTDQEYVVTGNGSELNGSLAAVTYTPSALDTVTEINRVIGGELVTESISLTNNAPRMAIHLDKVFFENQILKKLPIKGEDIPSEFLSQGSFSRYFKGLFVKTTSTEAASMLSLLLTNAYVELYYTNTIKDIANQVDQEIAESMRFSFGGVRASQYKHYREVPKEMDKMYVQGAAGSLTNIKILGFNGDPAVISPELDDLRTMSNDEDGNPLWLINEANLQLYVDDDFLTTSVDKVSKLFLYKRVQDKDAMSLYNSQLLDYLTAANISGIEGDLLEDDNGYYYKFRLTDYITNLLDGSTTTNIDNLGLKIYNSGDYPRSNTDTIVGSASWDPRGVVLYGGIDESKKPVLEINYSYQKIAEE